MKNDSVLSLLSIAKKAGRTASGEVRAETAVRSGKASLAIVAADASANTQKKFRNMCTGCGIPFLLCKSREELGRAVGRDYLAVVAVLDQGLAGAIEKKLEQEGRS